MAATPQTTQSHAQTPKGGKSGKARNVDTRPAHVIFAERFNTEAKLMTRRFANLQALGNAKRARPTEEQLEKVAEWLRDNTEQTIQELSRRVRAQDVKPADDKPFAILGEAPARTPAQAKPTAPAKK